MAGKIKTMEGYLPRNMQIINNYVNMTEKEETGAAEKPRQSKRQYAERMDLNVTKSLAERMG